MNYKMHRKLLMIILKYIKNYYNIYFNYYNVSGIQVKLNYQLSMKRQYHEIYTEYILKF